MIAASEEVKQEMETTKLRHRRLQVPRWSIGSLVHSIMLSILVGGWTLWPLRTSQAGVLMANSAVLATQYPAIQRCSGGPPLQWRPHLDVTSKAHLAPIVALATLKHLNLTPIQLTGNAILSQHQHQQQQLVYHPQNVNNVGVNIEATFSIATILKRSVPIDLNAKQNLKLFYRVSASLSTTSALMTLANSNPTSQFSSNHANSSEQTSTSSSGPAQVRQLMQASPRNLEMSQASCALDLSEQELVQKANKIFKLNQSYILFLDQPAATMNLNLNLNHHHHQQQQQQQPMQKLQFLNRRQQQVGAVNRFGGELSLHPFASHELLTNQTSRALRKILCKSCGKF